MLPPKDYILSRSVDPLEIIGSFLKNEHYEVFTEVFGANIEESRSIYRRMVRFARDSGVDPDLMVEKVKQGRQVAQEIAIGDLTGQYSANDLAALDWFLRAQHAKMNQLYAKGTRSFPIPIITLLSFCYKSAGSIKEGPRLIGGPILAFPLIYRKKIER